MTSISSINTTALFILQQANTSPAGNNDNNTKSATDNITAIANGVSSETSIVKTKAASLINSALLDAKETNDGIVSRALDFLDSGEFKASDESVTSVLKGLIGDNGAKFAALVKAEKAKNPGMADDNAIANAMRGLIRDNRSKFGYEEFVIGFKLSTGGAIIDNIEDKNGNSTSKSLNADLQSAQAALTASAKILHYSSGSDAETRKAASSASVVAGFTDAAGGVSSWLVKWQDAFGF